MTDNERIWLRVTDADGTTLEEGPVDRGTDLLEWRNEMRLKHRARPLIFETREDGLWVEHSRIDA